MRSKGSSKKSDKQIFRKIVSPVSNNDYSLLGGKFYFRLILVLTPLIIYFHAVRFDYVGLDDTSLVVDNYPVLKKTKNLPILFTQSVFEVPGHFTEQRGYYRPILFLSFMFDSQVNGLSSPVFHFTNIALHIVVCFLLFKFLILSGIRTPVAMLLTLFFSIHPIHAHAVCWIPGRNDILLALFALASLIYLEKFRQDGKNRNGYWHLFFFACCLFTKETGILMPLLYLIYLGFWQEDIPFLKSGWKLALTYLPVIALFLVMKTIAMKGTREIASISGALQILWFRKADLLMHLGKELYPFRLNVSPEFNFTNAILGLAAFLTLVVIFLKSSEKLKSLAGLFTWALFLVPSLLVPNLPAYEHRNYLPMIGTSMILAHAPFFNSAMLQKTIVKYIVFALLILYGLLAHITSYKYKDKWTFWKDATHSGKTYAAQAHVNLGLFYAETKNYTQAKTEYETALSLDSTCANAANNLGGIYYNSGDKETARFYFMRELKRDSLFVYAIQNMGTYYKETNQWEKAIPYWYQLIRLNPRYLLAYENLEQYHIRTGRKDSVQYYRFKRDSIYGTEYKKYKALE